MMLTAKMMPSAVLTIALIFTLAFTPSSHSMTPLSFANGTTNSSATMILPNETTSVTQYNLSSTDLFTLNDTAFNTTAQNVSDVNTDKLNISTITTINVTATNDTAAYTNDTTADANATANNTTLLDMTNSAIANLTSLINATLDNATVNATALHNATVTELNTTTTTTASAVNASVNLSTPENVTSALNATSVNNVSSNVTVDGNATSVLVNATSVNATIPFSWSDNSTRVLLLGGTLYAHVKEFTDFFYAEASKVQADFKATMNASINDLTLTERLTDPETQQLLSGMYTYIILESDSSQTASASDYVNQISALLANRTCNQTTLVLVQTKRQTDCFDAEVADDYTQFKKALSAEMPTPIVVLPLVLPYCQSLGERQPERLDSDYSSKRLFDDEDLPTPITEYLYSAMAFALTSSFSPFKAPRPHIPLDMLQQRRLLSTIDDELVDMQRWAVEALTEHWISAHAESKTLKHIFGDVTDEQDRTQQSQRTADADTSNQQTKPPPSTVESPAVVPAVVNKPAPAQESVSNEVVSGDTTSASLWLLLIAAVVCLSVYGVMWMRSKSRQAWLRERRGYDDRELSQFEVTKQSTKAYEDDGL